MAYSTVAQIASEFKNIAFTATSSITDTEVDRFIEEADALIDSKLGNVYVTPITGVVSLILLRQISLWLVAQRVKDIQSLKTSKENTNQITKENRLDVKAMKMLDDILNDKMSLPDAIALNSSGVVRDYNSRNNVQPVFLKGDEQW